MTLVGTKMIRENRSAREIFEEVMANPGRAKFGFGEKLAIVNVDFQNAYTRIDEFKTAYETDPRQIEHTNTISHLARAKGMPVIWTHVAYMEDASDAGVWGTSLWGTGKWGGGLQTLKKWRNVNGIGFTASLRMATNTKNSDARWYSTDFLFEVGGVL